jgi:hypothetical protein
MIRGKMLLNNDDYLVIKTTPFWIKNWMWGGIYVQNKHSGQILKAKLHEKGLLVSTLAELAKRGIYLPDEDALFIVEEFAGAICVRGSIRWNLFFNTSAAELAQRHIPG